MELNDTAHIFASGKAVDFDGDNEAFGTGAGDMIERL
jgi:hypothetical protein